MIRGDKVPLKINWHHMVTPYISLSKHYHRDDICMNIACFSSFIFLSSFCLKVNIDKLHWQEMVSGSWLPLRDIENTKQCYVISLIRNMKVRHDIYRSHNVNFTLPRQKDEILKHILMYRLSMFLLFPFTFQNGWLTVCHNIWHMTCWNDKHTENSTSFCVLSGAIMMYN